MQCLIELNQSLKPPGFLVAKLEQSVTKPHCIDCDGFEMTTSENHIANMTMVRKWPPSKEAIIHYGEESFNYCP